MFLISTLFQRVFRCVLHCVLQSLSLCTALLMFMLSRDRLNMDLDRQSLDLMLKLLAVDYQEEQSATVMGKRTLNRNKDRAREVYDQWKAEGGATNQPEIEDVSVSFIIVIH